MNDVEIAELIAYSLVLWPGQRDVDQREQILGWRALLGDVDAVVGRAAMDELAADGDRFVPPPGLIRKHALLLSLASAIPTAEQAWAEVCDKIRTVGYDATVQDLCWRGRDCAGVECVHHEVSWSHPAVRAAVDALGWRDLCLSYEQMADRAHFIRFYAAAVDRMTRQAVAPPTVVAVEAARPAAELGPAPGSGRALPSPVVDERDDDAGLVALADVRAALETVRAAHRLDDD